KSPSPYHRGRGRPGKKKKKEERKKRGVAGTLLFYFFPPRGPPRRRAPGPVPAIACGFRPGPAPSRAPPRGPPARDVAPAGGLIEALLLQILVYRAVFVKIEGRIFARLYE